MRTRIVLALTLGFVWIAVPRARTADDPSPEPPADVVCRIVGNAALAAVTMVVEHTKAGGIDVSVSTRGVELGKELKVN